MSADPARPGVDHPAVAAVLPFPTAGLSRLRAARKEHRVGRGEKARRTPMPGPGPDLTPQQKLAASLEARFAAHGRTLTDADTAEDMLITLATVRTMLEGARAQGILTDDAYRDLDAMIEGMMAAPGLLG
ncbi:hypothetical protein ACFC08_28520 [Streptomyces sp. NPDC056112]|uniref:hypothetical protein n=1 Tax=Streptomyces sp. NPDC056112 TaxID=3345715 RepID=UPI0035DCA6AB